MIELKAVTKTFAGKGGTVRALDDISFTVAKNEIFGIIGKSGAGKSTLLRLLSLQIPPDSGTLKLLNVTVDRATKPSNLQQTIRQTSFVFQGFSLLYNRTVVENVALPLKLQGIDLATREAKAREMLGFVGLDHRADAYPITLSGGEAQRAAIARALISDPKIIYLDEPTSALDALTMKGILDLLKKIHDTYEVTMVLVAHQIDVVRYMCDRVLLMDQGRIRKLEPIEKTSAFRVDHLSDLWGSNCV